MAVSIGRLKRRANLVKIAAIAALLWLTVDVLARNSRRGFTTSADGEMSVKSSVTPNPVAAPTARSPERPDAGARFDDVVLYNRIPKCASTSVRMVMKQLASSNKYNIHVSRIHSQESLNDTAQNLFVEEVTSLERPLLFVRHVFFVSFSRYRSPEPIYINMVREPLDRLVSDYYFKRYNLRYMFPMSQKDRERTYNECVQENHTECVGNNPKGYYRIIPYFCGQDPDCFVPSEKSLAQAKQNVEKHFLVVGIVDYVQEFLKVIEKLIPRYFRGAPLIYKLGGDKFKRMAKTKKKDDVDKYTVSLMKSKLRYDYDFYSFVKQRFKIQYNDLFHVELS